MLYRLPLLCSDTYANCSGRGAILVACRSWHCFDGSLLVCLCIHGGATRLVTVALDTLQSAQIEAQLRKCALTARQGIM